MFTALFFITAQSFLMNVLLWMINLIIHSTGDGHLKVKSLIEKNFAEYFMSYSPSFEAFRIIETEWLIVKERKNQKKAPPRLHNSLEHYPIQVKI